MDDCSFHQVHSKIWVGFCLNIWKTLFLREHQQKTLSCLADFGHYGGQGEGLSEFVKKGKFVTKIFFSDNVE